MLNVIATNDASFNVLQDVHLANFWKGYKGRDGNIQAAAILEKKFGIVLTTSQIAHAKERILGELAHPAFWL